MNRSALLLDSLGLGLMAVALATAALALSLFPQRLAQRPAAQAVVALHLNGQGQLRLWNQPIQPQQLPGLLAQATRRNANLRLRLLPDASVPWGVVQHLISQLEPSGLPLEVQLP
jgi:biopolymer transport protein ExbD